MGQLKINFGVEDKELELYVRSKTSAGAFLKDLAKVEMLREKYYIENKTIINNITSNEDKTKEEVVEVIKETVVKEEPKKVNNNEDFDFNIDDLM